MKSILKLTKIIFIIFFIFPINVFTQNLEITDIQFRRDSLLVDVFFSVRDGGGLIKLKDVYDDLRVVEKKFDKSLEMNKLHYQNLKGGVSGNRPGGNNGAKVKVEQMTISVALDYSGSMSYHNKLEQAKKAVKSVFDVGLPDGSIWFTTFHHDISAKKILTPSNYDEIVGSLVPHPKNKSSLFHTNLRTVIVNKIIELKESKRKGKKVLIILTDGKHDLKNHPDLESISPDEKQVLDWASKADIDIYTIGIGDNSKGESSINKKFLEAIPAATKSKFDGYLFAKLPKDLGKHIKKTIETARADYMITLRSNFDIYEGVDRTVTLRINKGSLDVEDDIQYIGGSGIDKIKMFEMDEKGNIVHVKPNVFASILTGITALFLLFVVSVILYPATMKKIFDKKFTKKYIPEDDDTTEDCPVCGNQIVKGELIVTKCEHKQHKTCWEGEPDPNKCIMNCDAKFDKGFKVSDFFDQKGETVSLNWMFFGALALFVAYIIIALSGDSGSYSSFMQSLLATVTGEDTKVIKRIYLSDFTRNTLNGIFVSASLGFAFSYLEERRKRMDAKTFIKIFVRTFILGLIGFIVFFIGSSISKAINMDYISGLIMWLLFGLIIGASLSIGTSISVKNGIIGGLLASIIAYQPFYFIIKYVGMPDISKVISFIIYGAILGLLISVVNKKLEKYVLKITQVPAGSEKWQGVDVKIHKWMNTSQVVTIGKSVDNHFTVHWEDQIPESSISLEKTVDDKIFLNVLDTVEEKPVQLNNRILVEGTKRQISNNDIIQIGETKFQYMEE